MNHLKVYIKLMCKAKIRNWNKNSAPVYVEAHHIFPKSIFGDNNGTVCLTAREHYIAHALLYKGFITRYGIKNLNTKKMRYAWWQMSNTRNYCNSTLYERLRLEFSKMQKEKKYSEESKKKRSLAYTGENNPNWGKITPEEVKKKISNTLRGKKPWEAPPGKLNMNIWKRAEELHDIWIKNNKPGSWIFAKYTQFSHSNLNYIHKKFKKGWVPHLDNDYQNWLSTLAPN